MSPRPLLLGSLVAAIGSLAACATPDAPTMNHQCNADAASAYVGKSATPDTVDAARKAAGADIARTLSPGQVVTMEYRDGRLNLYIDDARTITRITCG